MCTEEEEVKRNDPNKAKEHNCSVLMRIIPRRNLLKSQQAAANQLEEEQGHDSGIEGASK